MQKLNQLHMIEVMHSDPKELQARILRSLRAAPPSATTAFAKIKAAATK